MSDLSGISRPVASSQEDIDNIKDAINRRFVREKHLGGSQFNGSTKYINCMLAVITSLMVAAVIGMWSMYGKVEALGVEVSPFVLWCTTAGTPGTFTGLTIP